MGPLESDDFDENNEFGEDLPSIRRTSCKLIQIFANPLALFFQIRHFRHCMPTFLGMSVLCSML